MTVGSATFELIRLLDKRSQNPIQAGRVVGATKRVSQEFFNRQVWTFQHNLGRTPAVQVYTYVGGDGFGVSPFGTAYFGGSNWTVQAASPQVENIDQNTIRIVWTGLTSGKVVCTA